MRKFFASLSLLAAMTVPSSAWAEDFDNASVVALTDAGIGESVLLAKIASLPCSYDVSTDSLIELRQAGVSSVVIAAMVDRCMGSSSAQGAVDDSSGPAAMRAPGLYIDFGREGAHDIQRIRPTVASGGRVTGNGSLLFPFRMKLGVPRASAQTKSNSSQPVFYFYFETDDRNVGDFGTSATVSAQSPAEFSLVRFKEKKGQRELVVGKAQAFSASVGIDPKDSIQFAIEEIRDGIFSATPLSPLEAGEYGFVLRAGSDSYRIYDFRVP